MIRTTIASVMLVIGVAFVTIAALGVARLPDVFQRMHAATKAGGIGVSFVVGGTLIAGGVSPVTGGLTIVLMLLTLSAASQLLARAAYMSGAEVQGLERGDPLGGVLARQDAPLEKR